MEKINWDEIFEKYTKDKVLQKNYSEIARELGVSEKAVRKHFKKRGVIDPRKQVERSEEGGPRRENDLGLGLSRGGGKTGNTNSLKHGLYAEVFWTERGKEIYLELVKNNDFLDPVTEIRLLQAKIASGELHKVEDVLIALEIISKLYDKAIMLSRNEIERRRLTCEQERVKIAREKLELEKSRLGEGGDVDIEIEVFGSEAEIEN